MAPADSGPPAEPPSDPEEWSDEQWLTWLKATDPEAEATDDASEGPTPLQRIARSSSGQVFGQAMLGIARAIYGRQDDEVAIVAENPSEPEPDEPFTVHLDPEHPEQSSVVFHRPSD